MPFRREFLFQSLIVALAADAALLWRMPSILEGHTYLLVRLLDLAGVPWTFGRGVEILPGAATSLVQTASFNYQAAPSYPWYFAGIAALLFAAGYRYWAAPLRPLLALIPIGLAATAGYLQWIAPSLRYSPEDFCGQWLREESYSGFCSRGSLPWDYRPCARPGRRRFSGC
jgi:hypothetical protein